MMKAHLVYKLFGSYLLIALVAIITIHIHLGGHIKAHLNENIEQNLFTYARLINVTASLAEMERAARHIAATAETRVTIIDKEGVVLADTERSSAGMENHFNRPEIQEARVRGTGKSTRLSSTLEIETLYVAIAIRGESDTIGYIRLARPLTDVRDSMNALNWSLVQSFLLIGVLSFLVAYIFSIRLVSPIQEMEEFTTKLQKGEYPGTLLISAADERGQLARNINYLVSELREKIDAAHEEKGKLEAAFSSMNDGVLILDGAGVIEVCNDSFSSMFPADVLDIVGKTPLDAFRNIELQDALDNFSESGELLTRQIAIGREIPRVTEITICPIRGLPGNENKIMVVFHDVTRMKELEKMRVDFVANVTHEIKTPLTAILGCIETLQDGALEKEEAAREFLDVIRRHAERLNRLVDDLLIISNLELGELPLTREELFLEPVIDSLWPLIQSQAEKKGIALTKEIPSNLPAIEVDRDRVIQVVLNVLDNAVKFTDAAGSVALEISPVQDNLEIRITDTGIGIPPHDLARLGERFYRVDRARSRQSGGTGLGLSIVKHLMAAHGGSMNIRSRLGTGTEVRLLFPLAKRGREGHNFE